MRVGGGIWSEITDGAFLVDAGYSDEVSVGDEVGSQYKTLTTANMPSHNHTFTGTSSSHTHTFSASSSHNHTFTGTSASHNHTFSGSSSTTSSSGSHTHAVYIHTSGSEATGYGLMPDSVSFGDRPMVYGDSMNTSSAGSHTHTVTASGTVGSTSITPSGTVGSTTVTMSGTAGSTPITPSGTISSTGNGTEFEITPKAIVVKRWRRVS